MQRSLPVSIHTMETNNMLPIFYQSLSYSGGQQYRLLQFGYLITSRTFHTRSQAPATKRHHLVLRYTTRLCFPVAEQRLTQRRRMGKVLWRQQAIILHQRDDPPRSLLFLCNCSFPVERRPFDSLSLILVARRRLSSWPRRRSFQGGR